MANIVKFSDGRWQNMDQLIYCELVLSAPKFPARERTPEIVCVFNGQKEDLRLTGSDAVRFVDWCNAHADTMFDLIPDAYRDALEFVRR